MQPIGVTAYFHLDRVTAMGGFLPCKLTGLVGAAMFAFTCQPSSDESGDNPLLRSLTGVVSLASHRFRLTTPSYCGVL